MSWPKGVRATMAADFLRDLELALAPPRPPAPDRDAMLAELRRPAVAKLIDKLAVELELPPGAFRLTLANALAVHRQQERAARQAVLEGTDDVQ